MALLEACICGRPGGNANNRSHIVRSHALIHAAHKHAQRAPNHYVMDACSSALLHAIHQGVCRCCTEDTQHCRGTAVALPWHCRGTAVALPWLCRGYAVALPPSRARPSVSIAIESGVASSPMPVDVSER